MSKENAEKRAKALEWACQYLREHPTAGKLAAAEQTALRFDLSPLEEDWLLRHLGDGKLAQD